MILSGVGLLCACYLIGAVPFGYLLFRLGKRGDIRELGSGNIGATNVLRSGGKAIGVATLVLDAGKGAIAVSVAHAATGDPRWEAAAALAAVVGHCYPVFLRFRGGKGIATGCGAYGLIAPVPMGITLLVFLAATLATRIVSVGSISAGVALPLLVLWLRPERALLLSVSAAALLVIGRHHGNIRRIIAGEEDRIHGG